MRELLKELRSMKKTILVSSHILPELADICNKIGIIERGKLLFNGDVDTAIAQVRQKHVFLISVGDRNEEAAKTLQGFPEIDSVDMLDQNKVIKVALRDGKEDGSFLPERLIQGGYKLHMFKEEEIDLEDVFMGITKGITN
jgi:ABC-2 type transport system ATP-binding protein